MKSTLSIFITLFTFLVSFAQNTIQLDPGASSPNAVIEDISWLEGHWVGKAFGGEVEEIWTAPKAGSMMGMFRSIGDEIGFYEFMIITEIENSLTLRIKHFNPDLTGWEEKDKFEEFKLVKKQENKMMFEDFTVELVSKNELHLFVQVSEGEEKHKDLHFVYFRK